MDLFNLPEEIEWRWQIIGLVDAFVQKAKNFSIDDCMMMKQTNEVDYVSLLQQRRQVLISPKPKDDKI